MRDRFQTHQLLALETKCAVSMTQNSQIKFLGYVFSAASEGKAVESECRPQEN